MELRFLHAELIFIGKTQHKWSMDDTGHEPRISTVSHSHNAGAVQGYLIGSRSRPQSHRISCSGIAIPLKWIPNNKGVRFTSLKLQDDQSKVLDENPICPRVQRDDDGDW